MQYIQSRNNQHIKHIAQLKRSKSYRQAYGESIAEGERTLSSFISSQHTIQAVYMTQAAYEATSLNLPEDRVIIVPTHVMEKISSAQTPSGILGHIKLSNWQSDHITSGLCLVNIADPGNVGTLIRTSIALGHRTIMLIDCADPWNPKVVRASAGTVAHATIHITTWEEIRHAPHITTYALSAHNAQPIEEVTFTTPLILVGNEAHGLPQDIIDDAAYRVKLKMSEYAESYNAAIAGSIALYMAS